MTNKEAIKELKGLAEYLDEHVPAMGSESLSMAISALRAQQTSGWISVKDRLPEERSGQNQEFNVMVKGFSRATALCYMGNGAWEDDIGAVYNVTHWQPLPEPPNKEEEK